MGRCDGADGRPGIFAGSLRVQVEADGTLRVIDEELGLSLRADELVDEGDRGDLYHFDPAGAPVRARLVRAV